MASFLTSALGGVNNLSTLVDRVNQIKGNIERTLDNAVGEGEADAPTSNESFQSLLKPVLPRRDVVEEETELQRESALPEIEASIDTANADPLVQTEAQEVSNSDETSKIVHDADRIDSQVPNGNDNDVAGTAADLKEEAIREEPVLSGAPTELSPSPPSREVELQEALKRREAQLEKSSRRLAEQEEQLHALREALETASADKRIRAAEARAEQLMKEGLILSEKQGKAEQALKKVRKEKEEIDAREKSLAEQLKKEQESKAALQNELTELRDVRKRGEASIAQIAESNADAARRLEEARSQASQALQREQEMKTAMERTFAEVADLKKQVTAANQQLAAAKREAEHAKFQLKEQMDTRQLHGSRAESMERSLAETKVALDEQIRESRMLESELRSQIARLTESLHLAEKRGEEASSRNLDVTAPLMRKIDQLTEELAKREQASSTLLTRAVAAEAAEAEAVQARRRAEQARSDLQVRLSELETQLAAARADSSRALSDSKIAQKRAEEAERERDNVQRAMDALRMSTDAKIAEQRLTEMQLRQTIALEAEKVEKSKRTWEEKSRELEERHQMELRRCKTEQQPQTPSMMMPSPMANHIDEVTSTGLRRFQSDGASSVVSGSAVTQDEILGSVLFGDEFASHVSTTNDVHDGASSRYLLQTSELQAGVRRRDARIKVLTEQIDSVSRQKEELASKVFTLQQRLDSFQGVAERETEMTKTISSLQSQSALLMELLGEKEEQIEALQSDMEDVKAKFREQIEVLLAK